MTKKHYFILILIFFAFFQPTSMLAQEQAQNPLDQNGTPLSTYDLEVLLPFNQGKNILLVSLKRETKEFYLHNYTIKTGKSELLLFQENYVPSSIDYNFFVADGAIYLTSDDITAPANMIRSIIFKITDSDNPTASIFLETNQTFKASGANDNFTDYNSYFSYNKSEKLLTKQTISRDNTIETTTFPIADSIEKLYQYTERDAFAYNYTNSATNAAETAVYCSNIFVSTTFEDVHSSQKCQPESGNLYYHPMDEIGKASAPRKSNVLEYINESNPDYSNFTTMTSFIKSGESESFYFHKVAAKPDFYFLSYISGENTTSSIALPRNKNKSDLPSLLEDYPSSTNDLIYAKDNILCGGGEEMIRPDTFFCFDGQKQELLFAWTIEDIASKIYPQTIYDSGYLGAAKPVLDYGKIEYRNGDSIFAGSIFSRFGLNLFSGFSLFMQDLLLIARTQVILTALLAFLVFLICLYFFVLRKRIKDED